MLLIISLKHRLIINTENTFCTKNTFDTISNTHRSREKERKKKKYHRIRKRSSINSQFLVYTFCLKKKRKINLFVVINLITRKRYEIDMNCCITSPHTKPFSADSHFVFKCASSVKELRHIGNMTIRGGRGHWQKCQDSYIDRSISLIE